MCSIHIEATGLRSRTQEIQSRTLRNHVHLYFHRRTDPYRSRQPAVLQMCRCLREGTAVWVRTYRMQESVFVNILQ